MPLLPTEHEIQEMAEQAKWLAKVEEISLEEAVDRVTLIWEKRARAESGRPQEVSRPAKSKEEKKPLKATLGDLLKAKTK